MQKKICDVDEIVKVTPRKILPLHKPVPGSVEDTKNSGWVDIPSVAHRKLLIQPSIRYIKQGNKV